MCGGTPTDEFPKCDIPGHQTNDQSPPGLENQFFGVFRNHQLLSTGKDWVNLNSADLSKQNDKAFTIYFKCLSSCLKRKRSSTMKLDPKELQVKIETQALCGQQIIAEYEQLLNIRISANPGRDAKVSLKRKGNCHLEENLDGFTQMITGCLKPDSKLFYSRNPKLLKKFSNGKFFFDRVNLGVTF